MKNYKVGLLVEFRYHNETVFNKLYVAENILKTKMKCFVILKNSKNPQIPYILKFLMIFSVMVNSGCANMAGGV